MSQKMQGIIAILIGLCFWFAAQHNAEPLYFIAIAFIIGGICILFQKKHENKVEFSAVPKPTIQEPTPQYNVENHRIAGISYYEDNVRAFESENYEYHKTKSELLELYDEYEKIYEYEYDFDSSNIQLVPEPENEYDHNAIAILSDDKKIGHIKKGSCSHIKNLIKAGSIKKLELEVYGGKYKQIVPDDKGGYSLNKDNVEMFGVLHVYTETKPPEG